MEVVVPGIRLRCGMAIMAAIAAGGCGASPITPPRIERAITSTFANLVHVQVSWMGLPAMKPTDFAVKASCRRMTPGAAVGSGEWACLLLWQGPERRPLRDTYDLFVNTDGCYLATVEGDALGGPTLAGPNGRRVRNLLYAFEGCFDTT